MYNFIRLKGHISLRDVIQSAYIITSHKSRRWCFWQRKDRLLSQREINRCICEHIPSGGVCRHAVYVDYIAGKDLFLRVYKDEEGYFMIDKWHYHTTEQFERLMAYVGNTVE